MTMNISGWVADLEIMVLITLATSEVSDKPAHPRSLSRALAVRTRDVRKKTKSLTKTLTSSPIVAAHAHLKSEDKKYHNLITWLI